MGKKLTIYDDHASDAFALFDSLCALSDNAADRLLTQTQARAIATRAALPCRVIVQQRTPRGVVYVDAGVKRFDLDRAGRLLE